MDLFASMATYVRIVEGKSLSAAARALRLSLPAVSRQLTGLEAELGASLVVRSTRRLQVTEAGRQWYEHCVRVLAETEDARAALATQAVRGRLVVSASFTFGSLIVAPRLARLVESHPQLTVDLRLEDHAVDLVGEGVDVALRAGPRPPDSTALVAHVVTVMDRVVVVAPKLARKVGLPKEPEDLGTRPCLVQLTQAGAIVRWQLRRGDDERLVDVRGQLRTTAPVTLRDLAVSGAGFAYLPTWLVADDLAAGRLRRVLPGWSAPPIEAYALHRAELRQAPRVRAFLDAMRGEVAASPVSRARRRPRP